MSEYILEMKNISKAFAVRVLKNINFNLKKGEVHALVGGNGAGKSTLMKIMSGVYSKDSGEILVDGKPVQIDNIHQANDQGIAMIFQELSLIQSMTVAENVFLGQEIKKGVFRDKREMNALTRELLSELGLSLNPETVVSDLSVGVSQMVEIVKALSKNAKIMIFDEPTASLSDKEAQYLFQIIEDLKAKGVSIVYISHRMNEIMEIADRVTILRDGIVAHESSIADLDLNQIIRHMLGPAAESTALTSAGVTNERVEKIKNAEVLLEVENLKVDEKVSDISFNVHKGEILGLAGLMGSGRTEIVEALFGKRDYESGEIRLNGQVVKNETARQAIESGFALVPEDRRKQGLVLQHSIKNNAILPNLTDLFKKGFVQERKVDKIVDGNVHQFNIVTDDIHKQVGLLSGGNQQKVVFSKWFNTNPDILMLDEPTAGVDIGAKREIINIIRDFADQGKGVIFISSELSELLAACDRIIVLFDGKITGEFYNNEHKSEEDLQHAIQVDK